MFSVKFYECLWEYIKLYVNNYYLNKTVECMLFSKFKWNILSLFSYIKALHLIKG